MSVPTIEVAPGITATTYRRRRSGYIQARIRVGDKLIRRSTHALSEAGALAAAKCIATRIAKDRDSSVRTHS